MWLAGGFAPLGVWSATGPQLIPKSDGRCTDPRRLQILRPFSAKTNSLVPVLGDLGTGRELRG